MSQNLYIMGAGPNSGKSVITLAIMEYLSGHTDKMCFFRPVIYSDEKPEPLITLVLQRYQIDSGYESLYGCSSDVARKLINEDRYDELIKRILEKYRELQRHFDHILCVGTDYTYASSTLEFDFNTDVANNLGCLVLPVVSGFGRENSVIKDALNGFHIALQERQCDVFATIVNGVADSQVDSLSKSIAGDNANIGPTYVVPNEATLLKPSLGDIAKSLEARVLHGGHESLNRGINNYIVAAMQVPDFLDHLVEGCLVMTPGDRSDIILSCYTSFASTAYPRISGLLLTGGLKPESRLEKLLAGLGKPQFAVLITESDTFTTAMKVSQVRSALTADNDIKIATALGLVEAHVPLADLEKSLTSKRNSRVTPFMFEYELLQQAKNSLQHIVLPEGEEERMLRAAEILSLRGVVQLTLLGNKDVIRQKIQSLGLRLEEIEIIDPNHSDLRQQFADTYYELRQHKGISRNMAYDTMADVSYFGTMMVHHGKASGMVSGSVHTTQQTIRPAFEIIKTLPETSIVSSVFFMCLRDQVLVYGDCAINPDPDAHQLADIAISSAKTASLLGISARIAMLSYSTGTSGKGVAVNKVREATKIIRESRPDLMVEGPIQYDAAINVGVAKTKLPASKVAGNATVFIFPDLNTGNNTYKAVQRSANAIAIGPILQGLRKPVNDLSRGCSVTDIVNTVAITAIQAQAHGKRKH